MFDERDTAALMREHPHFGQPPIRVVGPHIAFRLARVEDAEFILSLRLDPEKNRHLSPTPSSVERQRDWLREEREGFYFIIECDGAPVGTVRLYGQRGTSFAWGSWILRGHPRSAAIESALMVYRVGLDLGFTAAHFDVRKANDRVCSFHERFGAKRTGEDDLNYYYSISKSAILDAFRRHRIDVSVDW